MDELDRREAQVMQDEERVMYSLVEDVEDLIMTALFDTRDRLIVKVKTLSGSPE